MTAPMQTRSARPHALWACVGALACLAQSADAQEAAQLPSRNITGTPAANVFVDFEGGLVGRDMASVIATFSGDSEILPTTHYRPEVTSGLCGIIATELLVKPEFCTKELLDAITALNEKQGLSIDPDAISPRTGIILPDVAATQKQVNRIFDFSNEVEANRANELLQNPGWTTVISEHVEDLMEGYEGRAESAAPKITQLTISRITWEFGIGDDEAIQAAKYLSGELSSRNLAVTVERTENFNKVIHAPYPADMHHRKWCSDMPTGNAEGAFAHMTGSLYDTSSVIQCEGGGQRPQVIIMDQPIGLHPDLVKALPAAAQDSQAPEALDNSCQPQAFDRMQHHGTLLATIIASEENQYGFRGIAPHASLVPFEWHASDATRRQLKDFVEDVRNVHVPQVFLFASEFELYSPPPNPGASEYARKEADKVWRTDGQGGWLRLLANDSVRIAPALVREFFHQKSFLVAAAGQPADGSEGRPIDWETPMSPQNLGDFENVLIVGACTDCDSTTASMWRSSNRGKVSDYVSLLGPGGGSVPSYIAPTSVGATTGGTSAAAAFAAGVAANMSACYPLSYNFQPGKLKEQIILASRPLLDHDNELEGRVAGGVLDPAVSMLDPNKTWLKLKSQRDVRPVEFKHWCDARLEYEQNEGDMRDSSNLRTARRLTTVHDSIVVQHVKNGPQSSLWRQRGVKRERPGRPAAPTPLAVVEYAGEQCRVELGDMTDLFLDQEYDAVASCEEVPACE